MTRGSCLCGTVRFELSDPTTEIGMCHCSKCRKVSGTGSNAVLVVGTDRFEWLAGADAIAKYSMDDGWGPWRCATCGSPVPKQMPGTEAYWVPAGLLDSDPDVRVAGHIWVGSRAPWDEIAGVAPRYDEAIGSARLDE